jgi:hypothetical protein
MKERQQKILSLLQDYAPTGIEQQKCTNFYHDLVKSGLLDKDIELNMVAALYDGLAYENWFWT